MPSLSTVVSNYIQAVKDSLSSGPDLGSNVTGNPQSYVRAQDLATVLELLQEALTTGTLTATGGTTTSVQDGAGTFTAGQQVGNIVEFDGNVTSALAGVQARVYTNDATTLNFRTALPAAPQTSDTYKIIGAMADNAINELREGRGRADAPRGNVYGDHRTALEGLQVLKERVGQGSLPEKTMATLSTVSGSTDTVIKFDVSPRLVPDELRGYKVTISGESRTIVTHDETGTMTLDAPLSSAPSSSTTATVTVKENEAGGTTAPRLRVHPGGQPGDNIRLANFIDDVENDVVNYTLPT
jgi:hypothetical protein